MIQATCCKCRANLIYFKLTLDVVLVRLYYLHTLDTLTLNLPTTTIVAQPFLMFC
jgi:hypothetical protein